MMENNPNTIVVAVDGPAGSGKSSVSRAVAKKLGFAFLDTGAAYRALTWFIAERQLDPIDEHNVINSLPDFDYHISTNPDSYVVWVGDHDVTNAIREPRVSASVSSVARIPAVRQQLTELFRSIIANNPMSGIVVEGRDITTVVAPDAHVRILLTASEEVRVVRRSAEITSESGADVAKHLAVRDAADSRVVDFMNAAEGVVTVDSTDLNFESTVDAVIAVISQKTTGVR
jgi:cytidylate kinase